MLHSAPSLSVFNVNTETGEESESSKTDADEEILARTVTIGDTIIDATDNGDFSFGKNKMGQIQEEESSSSEDEQGGQGINHGIQSLNLEPEIEPASPPMFLASGLGIDSFDIAAAAGGGGFPPDLVNLDESCNLEDYYRRMVDEYPLHPLYLANYAQLLQDKGELNEAEEYYRRASMADPTDGDILIKYAKLEWQLHHVKGRAMSNFERAIQAAPHNSQALAAYASFLWEIDDDDDQGSDDEDIEEYHKRMIQENPSDSLVLRNYAQFLYQTKRDLQGAEEYYSRAIVADPRDGEIKSQYAKLVWEHKLDHDRASTYFEQAVEAAPQDSNVLAAYAKFLWETEEDSSTQDQFQEALVAVATA